MQRLEEGSTQDLLISTPKEDDMPQFLQVVRREFFPKRDFAKFAKGYMELIKVPVSDIGKTADRSAELYALFDKPESGFLVLHFYSAKIIKPQLYFIAEHEQDGRISSLRLSRFEDLFSKKKADLVGELAYYWIRKDLRRLSYGGKLFAFAMQRFKEILTGQDTKFTIAQGPFKGSGKGEAIRRFLLDKERENNGVDSEGKVVVTGISISVDEIKELFQIDCSTLKPAKNAVATAHLSEKFGLKLLGYSKNLSPVYGA